MRIPAQAGIFLLKSAFLIDLYVFEEPSGKLVNNTLKNNSFYMTTLSKIYLSRGRKHFIQCSGNDALDTDAFTFADGDTTPSVGKGGSFAFANSAPCANANQFVTFKWISGIWFEISRSF
jgi:hypothetical protein